MRIQRTFLKIITDTSKGRSDTETETAPPPHQRSCQDVHMDPHYQKPPHYLQIQHHRSVPQPATEVNEMGPTIQQGVIQCPAQRSMQSMETRQLNAASPVDTQRTVARVPSLSINNASTVTDIEEDKRSR